MSRFRETATSEVSPLWTESYCLGKNFFSSKTFDRHLFDIFKVRGCSLDEGTLGIEGFTWTKTPLLQIPVFILPGREPSLLVLVELSVAMCIYVARLIDCCWERGSRKVIKLWARDQAQVYKWEILFSVNRFCTKGYMVEYYILSFLSLL